MKHKKSACGLVREARENPDCFGGQQGMAARQIADILNRIPRQKYVEPFVGVGAVFRRVEHRVGEKVVANDIDCRRIKVAKKRICGVKQGKSQACNLIKNATTCGRDWKSVVKAHDSSRTLFYLDPPYEFTKSGKGRDILRYKYRNVPLADIVKVARHLKGSVAISYSDLPQTRKVLCKKPFRCKKIIKRAFYKSMIYAEILAVKTRR